MIYVCASIYNVQATNHFGSSQPSWLKSVSGQTGLGEKISKRSPKRTGKETPVESVQVSNSCSEPSPCDVSFSKGRGIIRFRFVKWSRISNIFGGAHDPLSKTPLRRLLMEAMREASHTLRDHRSGDAMFSYQEWHCDLAWIGVQAVLGELSD